MMIEFPADGHAAKGYLALPAGGTGPGVLVLHAWWGLNEFFTGVCDRLAAEGYVALAPDLYDGRTVTTIEEAELAVKALSGVQAQATIADALAWLRAQPAVGGRPIGLVGFSMGAAFALELSGALPEAVAAVVTFYGAWSDADYAHARAAYLGHFAEADPWEPEEGVREMEARLHAAGRPVTFHTYPGAGHWFFEANRPDAYNAEAAKLAWERTLAFLRAHL